MRRSVLLLSCLWCTSLWGQAPEVQEEAALALVNQQLTAYNQRSIKDFVEPFSDSVQVFQHPDQVVVSGKAAFTEMYLEMFTALDSLHCTILNRMVLGQQVIDHERIYGRKGELDYTLEAIVIYKIALGKIQEVYFIQQ